jgi:hypothetical protein
VETPGAGDEEEEEDEAALRVQEEEDEDEESETHLAATLARFEPAHSLEMLATLCAEWVPKLGAQCAGVSRAFPSWDRSILTEVYLCRARSCHEMESRMETPGQAEARATDAVVASLLELAKFTLCDGDHGETPTIPYKLHQASKHAAETGCSRPFPSWKRPILTEIYLCHACSCQEILRTETAGQEPLPRRSAAGVDAARGCLAGWRQQRGGGGGG